MSFRTTSQNPGFTIVVIITAVVLYLLVFMTVRRFSRKRALGQGSGQQLA